MDRFQAIVAFREVARQGGFAAAARALNLSPPSVSRLVSELEQDLGVRLFNRSTRQIGLTEEGEDFLRLGVSLGDELDSVTEEIRSRRFEPRGLLRISTVVAFGQERVAPAIPGFMARHPRVQVFLDISNRKVDLVQEHFDLGIRVGGPDGLASSSLKARKIYGQRLIFVATPAYVAEHGRPENLADLAGHRLVKQVSGSWGVTNQLDVAGTRQTLTLPDHFVVNSPNAARNAVLSGGVIGLLGDYLVDEMLKDGRLVRLLPEAATPEQPIHAVFVHRNYMPAKVRAFIDYLVEILGPPVAEGRGTRRRASSKLYCVIGFGRDILSAKPG